MTRLLLLHARLDEARRRNDLERLTARTAEERAFVAGQTLMLNEVEGWLAMENAD